MMFMVLYPDCPKCTNTELSIVDVEVQGMQLKGIKCNSCGEFLGFFQDSLKPFKELKEKVDDVESTMSDIEDEISSIKTKLNNID